MRLPTFYKLFLIPNWGKVFNEERNTQKLILNERYSKYSISKYNL